MGIQSKASDAIAPYKLSWSVTTPYLCLLFTMVMFGAAFASSKVVVREIPFEVAAAIRFGGGGILLLFWQRVFNSDSPRLSRDLTIKAATSGMLGVFAYNVCFFWGLTLAPSIDGSIIVPVLSPIFTILILFMFSREAASRSRVLGMALGFSGACLFVTGAVSSGAGADRMAGDMLFVVGALIWGLHSIFSKSMLASASKSDTLQITVVATISGSIALLLMAAPKIQSVSWNEISTIAWLNTVFLIIGPTVLAYLLYYKALKTVSASTATVAMFLVPAFGTIASTLFLGESYESTQFLGVAFLVVGAAMALNLTYLVPKRQSRSTQS